jgi:hypothetical protein
MKSLSEKTQLLILVLITGLSRLPFIFDGYGVEEDSWGLVANAYEMKKAGHYLASRFPGHPLQEYVYRIIYDQPAWVYNFFSLLAGVVAVAFFFKALKKMQFNGAFVAALIFCFTPVFYIAGTYTIDFAWTIAFVMLSFYFLLDQKLILSGIFIGMATGCRITSEVFLLPWALLLYSGLDVKTSIKNVLRISIPAILVGIIWFIPVYMQYGKTFFDFSDQFPYPSIPKVIYKATVGVFGFTGMLALIFFGFVALKNCFKKNIQAVTLFRTEKLIGMCLLVILLHIISYLRLPQKSGYMVPSIPFFILFLGLAISEKQFRIAAVGFILAPFIFSINLTDPLRGSVASPLAINFKISGQEIFLDPLSGPIFSERSKRINKMNYCDEVLKIENQLDCRELIISGWWYNEIEVQSQKNRKNWNKNFRFYVDCSVMDSAKAAGAEIFYLPEQNLYNDEMFQQNCTDSLAKPFPEK